MNSNWDANWVRKLEIDIFPSPTRASQFEYFSGQGVQKILVGTAPDGVTIQFGDMAAGGNLDVYCKRSRDDEGWQDAERRLRLSSRSAGPETDGPVHWRCKSAVKGADGLFD